MSDDYLSTSVPSETEEDATPLPAKKQPVWQKILTAPDRENRQLLVALIYLLALSTAEVLAVLVAPVVGIVLYFLLLFLLLQQAAITWERPIHRFFLSLTLVPLIRIVSFSLPLFGFRLEFWYFFTSVPLFGAAYVVMRQLGMSWRQVGVTWRGWPLQLGIGLTGIGLGYVEYLILRPAPLAESFTWQAIWLPALILLISTGFLEEYIFRGMMQITTVEQLGRLIGVSYVALFFAVLHVGYRSVADFIFVLLVGLGFGFIALVTRNIIGVTLAHGLTNIFLFLVFPFIIGNPQAPLLPIAQLETVAATPTVTAVPTITIAVEESDERDTLTVLSVSTPTPHSTGNGDYGSDDSHSFNGNCAYQHGYSTAKAFSHHNLATR